MADDDKQAEFAFDLFSDIAPLLALFGDQFAKQFISESLTWLDHLIFAMVPLGILTVITGAIRVQGPRIAKSFIGRGRENRALAEIELMSSTSQEVCELYNGKSIIRVMGKPLVAQILVFPNNYDALKKMYEEADQKRLSPDAADDPVANIRSGTNNKSIERNRPSNDNSCGIHTFETATSQDGSRAELLGFEKYHSHSYQVISKFLRRLTGRKDLSHTAPLNRKQIFKSLGPPNLQLGLSSDQFQPGIPKKGGELFIAAVVAIVLQASLMAIASVTIYHEPTRRAISFEPKEYGYPCYIAGSILLSVGVAICSLAVERNTVEYDWRILTTDDGAESAAERKPMSKKKARMEDSPRLLWLQQKQEVNDQAFGGYAILAGPKYHIITSSRIEDMGSMLHSGKNPASQGQSRDESDDEDYNPQLMQQVRSNNRTWELITVCAAITAGIGFITQFMGLRGLTYPCSIAQLVAILLMALVRALIRRRLGREPCHCPAFARFEVDFLATRIVYCKAFRDFHPGLKDKVPRLNQQRPEEILRWKVKTARANDEHPFLSNTLRDLKNSYASRGQQQILPDRSELLSTEPAALKRNRNLLATKDSPTQLLIEEASSQQLLRVRERLGDLCKWPSEALESARSLVYSVEAFMEHFFPKRLDSLDWVIETVGLSTQHGIERPDHVSVPVLRNPENGKWQVGIGAIDAILSLWIASIEAQAADARKSSDEGSTNRTPGQSHRAPNWRRTKAGVDLRYNYCRILGDDFEDGSLKRDLSWWVDELIAEQSDSRPREPNTAQDSEKHANPRTRRHSTVHESGLLDGVWEISDARVKAKENDLIIGFNGRSKDSDPQRLAYQKGARELAISSIGHLPNILAQHLFTSFIWTVVEHLPEDCIRQSVLGGEPDVEIEGPHTFDPHAFVDTWRRPTLRHHQLTKLVRQLENFGLGSQTEVLLCMIPAFSFKDLLPNHIILKLIPQISSGQGWAETARCYNRLLEQGLRVSAMAEEKLCYNVVAATIDFLSFASEPYDEYITPPDELREELEDIVARLVSTRFAPVIKKLAQAYFLQRRNKDISNVFALLGTTPSFERLATHPQLSRLFTGGHDLDGCLEALRSSEHKLDFLFLEKNLNFSKPHRAIYEALAGIRKHQRQDTTQLSLQQFQVSAARTRDIFDWTPLHYASFLLDKHLLYRYFNPKQVKDHLSLHKELGPFRRSPIHMAAISGSRVALEWISECLNSEENERNAYDTVGTDGMSPLHLATKSGNTHVVVRITEERLRKTMGRDFWGRAAIHLAASHGHAAIVDVLLRRDSRIDAIDAIEKTPLDYLVKIAGELRDDESEEDAQGDETKAKDNLEEEEESEERVHDSDPTDADDKETEETAPQPVKKSRQIVDQKRAIFVEFAEKALENSLHSDKRGKTYLHHAVQHTNIATIGELLRMGYDLESKDSMGLTPLLSAMEASSPKIALKLLSGVPELDGRTANALVKDGEGNTPLMFAALRGYMDVVRFLVGLSNAKPKENESKSSEDEVGAVVVSSNDAKSQDSAITYGPLGRNNIDQTALHIALNYGEVEVATYLLHDTDQVQYDPADAEGNTLLLAAVRNPAVATCIPTIVEKWPASINDPDPYDGQTPLSWACEVGAESIVDLLLVCKDLDVNRAKSKWSKCMPLHIAVSRGNVGIVRKLLSNESIIIGAKDDSGETAIDAAARGTNAEIMHILLNHSQVNSKIRLDFLFFACRAGHPNIQEVVPSALKQIGDAEITDKELLELMDAVEELRSFTPYMAFVERAFSRDTWKSIDLPYHKAARCGNLEFVRRLKEHAKDASELDEDGWSAIEYANTYRLAPVDADIVDLLSQPSREPSPVKRPDMLCYPKFAGNVLVRSCGKVDHGKCSGSHVVKMERQNDELAGGCIRAQHCIPPLSATSKHFYFEVTVLSDSPSKTLAVGFCNKGYPEYKIPGWYPYSWGYQSDHGVIFLDVNFDEPWYRKESLSDDFGANGVYGANDTIGVGMDLETGKGFVTLNGVKRQVGDVFDHGMFKGRKMYPCVGFDSSEQGVGLQFEVNFDGTANHPFEYKGPYV